MSINKIEMQDTNGNVLYPHTSGDNVAYDSTSNVVQKIDEAMSNLASLKASLTTTINNKTGSSLSSSSTLDEITSKINEIVTLSSGTSDATATASQILAGQTAYVKSNKITGIMTNNAAVTSSLNCGNSYTIPAGYHNGSGKITANSLASQTSATATAEQILNGSTAYVNGSKVTGTMTNQGTQNYTLPINGSYTIPAGYHNGSGKITQNLTPMAAPIGSSGVNAFTDSRSLCTTATYNDYVGAYDLVFPQGYYDGVKTNRLHIPNLLPKNIVNGVNVGWEGNVITGTATVGSMGGCEIRDYVVGPGESLSVTLEKCPVAAVYIWHAQTNGTINFNDYNQYANAAWWSVTGTYFRYLSSGSSADDVYLYRSNLNLKINAYSSRYQGVRIFF